MDWTERGREILEKVRRDRKSYTREVLKSREVLARDAPEYLELFHKTHMHVVYERTALPPKIKELIITAVDAAQFYERGLRVHIRGALNEGATREEVLEALLAASLPAGMHALSVALPIFDEVVEKWEEEKKNAGKGGFSTTP